MVSGVPFEIPKSWLLRFLLGTILRPDALHKAKCTRGACGGGVRGWVRFGPYTVSRTTRLQLLRLGYHL